LTFRCTNGHSPRGLGSNILLAMKTVFQGAVSPSLVRPTVKGFLHTFHAAGDSRAEYSAQLAADYYKLATDFYEYGWGECFHFAPRKGSQTVKESLYQYERDLAGRLVLGPEMKVLDVGCGIGGPMRNIARTYRAHVTGITISPYQVERGRRKTERNHLAHLCELVEGDFNAMPFEDHAFHAAYTIESCCHAGDHRRPFGEVLRVLKPGALFAGTDWCMTERYAPTDPEHQRIKKDIENNNGIAKLVTTIEIERALIEAGFEVLETADWAPSSDPTTPWYQPLASGFSLRGFRNSRAGAFVTHQTVRLLEAIGLSPKGTTEVHDFLRVAQQALVEGGRTGIFTPHFFWLARKPE
jgi:sterol 24-C-methyltransferase